MVNCKFDYLVASLSILTTIATQSSKLKSDVYKLLFTPGEVSTGLKVFHEHSQHSLILFLSGHSLYFTPTSARYMPKRASQPIEDYKPSAPQPDRGSSLNISLSKRIEQLEQVRTDCFKVWLCSGIQYSSLV